MASSEDKFHSPEEIQDYILRNYTDLPGNVRGMAIGWSGPRGPDWRTAGGHYRVVVTDTQHVDHTIKIAPWQIDADLKKPKEERHSAAPLTPDEKRELIRKSATAIKARKKETPRERANDREHER